MPIYSYHCGKCEKDFEVLIGMSEKPVCPACGSRRLERLYSRVVKTKPARRRTAGTATAAKAKTAPAKRRPKSAPAAPAKVKAKTKKRPAAKRTSRR